MPPISDKRLSPQVSRTHPLWMELLNEQNYWESHDDLANWFSSYLGRPVSVAPAQLEAFSELLLQIRFLLYAQHFNRPLNLRCLNRELSALNLALHTPDDSALPLLRAVSDQSDDGLLNSLKQSILITFATDFARLLKGEAEFHLHRCEGLYRNNDGAVVFIDTSYEPVWRSEIDILVEREMLASENVVQRCADFFFASSRSKFCSDACRFSTFQISKQLRDPAYLAEKQKRYRQRKK